MSKPVTDVHVTIAAPGPSLYRRTKPPVPLRRVSEDLTVEEEEPGVQVSRSS